MRLTPANKHRLATNPIFLYLYPTFLVSLFCCEGQEKARKKEKKKGGGTPRKTKKTPFFFLFFSFHPTSLERCGLVPLVVWPFPLPILFVHCENGAVVLAHSFQPIQSKTRCVEEERFRFSQLHKHIISREKGRSFLENFFQQIPKRTRKRKWSMKDLFKEGSFS